MSDKPKGRHKDQKSNSDYANPYTCPISWAFIRDTLMIVATFGLAIFTYHLWQETGALVRDSQGNSERQLRAYVGIAAHAIENVADGSVPKVTLVFKNFGQTPAKDIRYWLNSKFGEFPAQPFKPEKFILFPTDVFSAFWTIGKLNAADMEGLKTGQRLLYVYGEITYLDAFNNKRWTKFRLFYGGDALMSIGRLGYAAEGNDAE